MPWRPPRQPKIKESLRGHVTPEAEDALELTLRNTRSTVALFGKVYKAVMGRSLSENNRPLYNTLDDLFEGRNALAHNGIRRLERYQLLIVDR